ncbi:MAG TPA: energy transducer TonB [Burkholderiaceae bacterium]|nr:energy transducer TonB [Burkholderiaceae bacterium]
MTAPAITNRRRPHWHAPEKGTGPAFALSLFAHALLFLSIAFVVRWKTEPVGTVSAELWGGFPAAAPAPAPVPVPVPEPIVEPPPPPPPKVEREPEPDRKADIVLEEKKKPEPPKKVEPPKPDPKKIEAQKREAAKAEAAKAEAAKAAAAKADAARRFDKELQRIAAAAGPAGSGPAGATGVSGGPAGGGLSPGFEGQVVGCIRPHIVFNVPDGVKPKQHVAEFEVQLLPTGEQATVPKLLKASGLAAYDQAVERAIRRCDPFPRPREGAMPRSLRLTFDPVDTR